MLKQILLITDGCSNEGSSPIAAASAAASQHITVNVIGISATGDPDPQAEQEVREIATAGGGQYEWVMSENLAQTVCALTRRTMQSTLQQVVGRELQQLLGKPGTAMAAFEQLPPAPRAKLVERVEQWSEEWALDVALLVDTSASMQPKLPAVRQAIDDLLLSLQARSGRSRLAVLHFPAPSRSALMVLPWTEEQVRHETIFKTLTARGTTPTGPALYEAIAAFEASDILSTQREDGRRQAMG